MSADPHDGKPGYEATDADPRALSVLGLGLALLVAVALLVSWWLLGVLGGGKTPPEHPMFAYRTGPDGPLLQASPTAEIEEHAREERQRLATYGWIDRQNGIVHVPIERAMALTLERGLPARRSEGAR